MERFILYFENNYYSPQNIVCIITKSRKLCSKINVVIRDVRISSKHIEFDISASKDILNEFVIKLKPIGNCSNISNITEKKIEKINAIERGIYYFNKEYFWECHEILENVWKQCHNEEKNIIQGIILTAAAFVHHQKNENDICISILGRALKKFVNFNKYYYRIDIQILKKNIIKITSTGNVVLFMI